MPRSFPVLLCATLLTHLSGCVWISTCADYERPIPMGISSPTLQAYVDVQWDSDDGLVLWRRTWTTPPHGVNFNSDERSGEVAECVITDLTVRYAQEEALHRPAELPAIAEYERKATYADGRDVYYHAEFKFPDLIDREESFTLEIEGYYQLHDGSRRPFKSKEFLEVEHDPLVRSILVVWANI